MKAGLKKYLGAFDQVGLTGGKQKIIAAFLQLSAQEGYSSVTMRRLATMAGLKASTIYSHFSGGRDQILADSLRSNYNLFALAVHDGIANAKTPGEALRQLVEVHLRQQLTRPENDMWDMLVATDRFGHFLQDALRAEVDEWLKFCDFMYEAILLDLGCENPRTHAGFIRVALDSCHGWWNFSGSEESILACIDFSMDMIRRQTSISA
ncbi:hypothetical protein ASF45_26495 [Pseudorhodoferax sp. Leaf265]|nr:hypothetical protein ASF45_26495 [Pseudorhodoferax sp. Leaf265]